MKVKEDHVLTRDKRQFVETIPPFLCDLDLFAFVNAFASQESLLICELDELLDIFWFDSSEDIEEVFSVGQLTFWEGIWEENSQIRIFHDFIMKVLDAELLISWHRH